MDFEDPKSRPRTPPMSPFPHKNESFTTRDSTNLVEN